VATKCGADSDTSSLPFVPHFVGYASSNRFVGSLPPDSCPAPCGEAALVHGSRPQRRARKEHVKRMGMPEVCAFTSIARPLSAEGLKEK
jgi:hypothetical protein